VNFCPLADCLLWAFLNYRINLKIWDTFIDRKVLAKRAEATHILGVFFTNPSGHSGFCRNANQLSVIGLFPFFLAVVNIHSYCIVITMKMPMFPSSAYNCYSNKLVNSSKIKMLQNPTKHWRSRQWARVF
jgi:hypothetical protein